MGETRGGRRTQALRFHGLRDASLRLPCILVSDALSCNSEAHRRKAHPITDHDQVEPSKPDSEVGAAPLAMSDDVASGEFKSRRTGRAAIRLALSGRVGVAIGHQTKEVRLPGSSGLARKNIHSAQPWPNRHERDAPLRNFQHMLANSRTTKTETGPQEP